MEVSVLKLQKSSSRDKKTILVGFDNLYFFIIIFDLYRFFLNY